MRLAISGSHRVGKSTLAEAIVDALPGHTLIPEPYYQLEDDGYDFEDPPSLEDFERQLERSLTSLGEGTPDVVFDRCPLDLVAYLQTHRQRAGFDIDDWRPRIREAMATLDLVVFVPVETPDRLPVDLREQRLRARVDGALRELVLDDALDLGVETLEVRGAVEARLRQALAHLARGTSSPG